MAGSLGKSCLAIFQVVLSFYPSIHPSVHPSILAKLAGWGGLPGRHKLFSLEMSDECARGLGRSPGPGGARSECIPGKGQSWDGCLRRGWGGRLRAEEPLEFGRGFLTFPGLGAEAPGAVMDRQLREPAQTRQ